MNNISSHQIRTLAATLHSISDDVCIAFMMILCCICAILLFVYVSFVAATFVGTSTILLVLIRLME